MNSVYPSTEILSHLQTNIENKKPFSLLRGGDTTLAIFSLFFTPGIVESGKWYPYRDRTNQAFNLFGKALALRSLDYVSIPRKRVKEFFGKTIVFMKQADYLDSFENYSMEDFKRGIRGDWAVVSKWKEIYSAIGIDIRKKKFCDARFNLHCCIEGQLNLLDIIQDKKIFCICNTEINELSNVASSVDYHLIPNEFRNPRGNKFFKQIPSIKKLIMRTAKEYDLFLIGAGFIGRNFCGMVKRYGGRSLDVGSLFDYWSGARPEVIFKGSAKRIEYNPETMLFTKLTDEDL